MTREIVEFNRRYWIAMTILVVIYNFLPELSFFINPDQATERYCEYPNPDCFGSRFVLGSLVGVVFELPVLAFSSWPGAALVQDALGGSKVSFPFRWLLVWAAAGLSAFTPFLLLFSLIAKLELLPGLLPLTLVAILAGFAWGCCYWALKQAEFGLGRFKGSGRPPHPKGCDDSTLAAPH